MNTFWQPNFQVWVPGKMQNGTFESCRGVQVRLLGHLWAAIEAKDLPRGTSRWFMWVQGKLLGHPGEPREAHPAAKGCQRGAKGRHRTTKTDQRWAKGSQNGLSKAPRRHQNGSKMDLVMVKTQNVKTSKKTLVFPFQMDWEPAKNMPKTVPKGPWQTQWRDREHKWQAR